jgi:hypothetical protein
MLPTPKINLNISNRDEGDERDGIKPPFKVTAVSPRV